MNRKFIFGVLIVLGMVTSVSMVETASAQKVVQGSPPPAAHPLLIEDFNYPVGSLLTDNGWTAHSGAGTNAIATVTPGLTLTGYPSSGVGSAVAMTTSGEDDNRTFVAQTTGAVYTAFMVNASEAAVDALGGYFFHIGPTNIGTTFRGRVWIKKDASNNIAFGISKASTSEVVFTPFSFALNTTYLVVVKYTIVDGATNDTVDLFVSTTTPATEPAPTISATDTIQTDISPGSVALRQGTAATSPTVRVDGIRIGTSWASVIRPARAVVDFNGDGKTDFAVFRNIGGGPNGQLRWYYNINGSGPTVALDWGLASDIVAPGDFDGDNKTDIAVWRGVSSGQPSGNGFFYILQSATSTVRIDDFGRSGDDPTVVGDYDGDGKDDVAVYRAGATGQQSTWFYRGSLNPANITFVPWGVGGDKVAPGDYDGDGRNDFVIARDSGGGQNAFWLRQTTAGVEVRLFGPTLFPSVEGVIIPNDFDSDGKTDLALAIGGSSTGTWYYQPSSGGSFVQISFGNEMTDEVAVGDYDGDGKADIAVWRNNGTFWVRNSSNGAISGLALGSMGDLPVAAFNLH